MKDPKDPMLKYRPLKGIQELGRKHMAFYTIVLGKATDGSMLFARQLANSKHAMRQDEVSMVLRTDEVEWLTECLKTV